jgi:hypothetical protein
LNQRFRYIWFSDKNLQDTAKTSSGNKPQNFVYPVVAKVEGLQSQGGEGAAVVNYRKPSSTQDLKFLGFPDG